MFEIPEEIEDHDDSTDPVSDPQLHPRR